MMKLRKNIVRTVLIGLLIGGSATAVSAQEMQQEQTQAASNVSQQELTEFVKVYRTIQMQNQSAQQRMMGIIKDNGLEVQRFNEIQQAMMQEDAAVDATDDELSKHEAATVELKKLQPQLEEQMKNIIEESELTMNRYQAVATALQEDQSLQQRFQKIMLEMTTEG